MLKRTSRFLCGASVAAVLCTPIAVLADHSWGNYHWGRTANPFTLKVGNNLTSSVWSAPFSTSIFDWSKSTVLDLQAVAGGARNIRKCTPTAGRVEVCNNTYGNNGWLGIAQIWASGSHITQAVMKLNDTYFNSSPYNKPEWRNLVMCQELGHTFGLDHQDEAFNNPNLGTCMDYTSNPLGPPNNEHPNQHDYEQLQIIYGHLDSVGTVFSSTIPNEAAGNSPSEWGQLMRSTNGGRTQTFVRELGGGHKVVTFVIWTEGRIRGHGG